MSAKLIKRIKPLYVIAGCVKINEQSPTLRKAVKEFLERVNEGGVFGEITNPDLRNSNDLMSGLNDNVCMRVVSSSYDKKSTLLTFEFEPYGPAKHVLDDVDDDRIQTWLRATVNTSGLGNTLKEIETIDVYIDPVKKGA